MLITLYKNYKFNKFLVLFQKYVFIVLAIQTCNARPGGRQAN